jgi:hypothetical protein
MGPIAPIYVTHKPRNLLWLISRNYPRMIFLTLNFKIMNQIKELTRDQISQQDAVDNAIIDLVTELTNGKYRMDDLIGDIRELIIDHVCENGLNLIPEMELYPYIQE